MSIKKALETRVNQTWMAVVKDGHPDNPSMSRHYSAYKKAEAKKAKASAFAYKKAEAKKAKAIAAEANRRKLIPAFKKAWNAILTAEAKGHGCLDWQDVPKLREMSNLLERFDSYWAPAEVGIKLLANWGWYRTSGHTMGMRFKSGVTATQIQQAIL